MNRDNLKLRLHRALTELEYEHACEMVVLFKDAQEWGGWEDADWLQIEGERARWDMAAGLAASRLASARQGGD